MEKCFYAVCVCASFLCVPFPCVISSPTYTYFAKGINVFINDLLLRIYVAFVFVFISL